MPATTTFKTLVDQLMTQTGLGRVLPSVTGITSQITLSNAYLQGPVPTQTVPRGSLILVTAGGAVNTTTYSDVYTPNPTTGGATITLRPNVGSSFTDAILFDYGIGIDHPDRVKEAINRALTNRCCRWQSVPLTFVTDGDMLASDTSAWGVFTSGGADNSANAPLSKTALSFPHANTQQVLTATGNGSTGTNWYVESTAINAPLNTRVTGMQHMFMTAIQVTAGSGTITLSVYDKTNSQAITTYYIRGSADGTFATTSTGSVVMMGAFNLPTNCKSFTYRVTCSAVSTTFNWYPIAAWPMDARDFPLAQRVTNPQERIGNFYTVTPTSGPGGMYSLNYDDEPFTDGGITRQIRDGGDHLTVNFDTRINVPVYYDELIYGSSLSAMTDTTTFAQQYVVAWAKFELYYWLYNQTEQSKWRVKAIDAKRSAESYEDKYVQDMTITGVR